jgi:hypothetical protein
MKPTDGNDLAAAIREFETALPGWWWSVGSCSLTRDASCGPRALCAPDCFDDVVSKAELAEGKGSGRFRGLTGARARAVSALKPAGGSETPD